MTSPALPLLIQPADPMGPEALGLLELAAAEARALYPELHNPRAPPPANRPIPPRGTYLLAWHAGLVAGMGAHQPLDDHTSELRRMYVHPRHRRQGVAAALLTALEAHAQDRGFTRLVLETGCRQAPALALYAAKGYRRTAPWGAFADDPTSVCFAKTLV